MRTITVSEFISLDGVIQAPGGPEEDPTGGFAHGGWTVPYWDDVIGEHMGEATSGGHDLLLGRGTYDIWAAHWPFVDDEFAQSLNAKTKYVASTTLAEPSWENTVVLSGDVAAEVAALKETDGPDLVVCGSAGLIQTLLAADLVDRFDLLIYPVVLGPGKRLFGEGTIGRSFTVTKSVVAPSGVVIVTYEKAGPVQVGSFAFEEPTDAEVARRDAIAES